MLNQTAVMLNSFDRWSLRSSIWVRAVSSGAEFGSGWTLKRVQGDERGGGEVGVAKLAKCTYRPFANIASSSRVTAR